MTRPTSDINYTAISTTYPVAGQDNDSEGFRENFRAISTGLATAKEEITALQANTLLSADLMSNTATENNMLGSTLYNGKFKQFYSTFLSGGGATNTPINLNNGIMQEFVATGDVVLTFTNWPESLYACIRLMLRGDGQSDYTITLQGDNNNNAFKAESAWDGDSTSTTADIVVSNTEKYKVVEAWSVDGGVNIFIRSLGEF
jgi:predicted HicB family RNase H-like nuclease